MSDLLFEDFSDVITHNGIEGQFKSGVANDVAQAFQRSNLSPTLIAFRAKNAFVEVMKFPNLCLGVQLSANSPVDLQIPSGVRAIRFFGDGDYWVSRNGRAQIPGAPVGEESPNLQFEMTGIYRPEGIIFYLDQGASFSVISASNNRLVSVMCWSEE